MSEDKKVETAVATDAEAAVETEEKKVEGAAAEAQEVAANTAEYSNTPETNDAKAAAEKKVGEIAAAGATAAKKAGNAFNDFLKEFEAFALKGNVMDLAIGVIIGAAFKDIVTSLTDNIINPLIGLLFQANLDTVGLNLQFGEKTVFFGFGAFVSAIINFLIMAFVLFCLLKFVNGLMSVGKKKEEPAEEEPAAPTQEELLAQILAELKEQSDVMKEPAE